MLSDKFVCGKCEDKIEKNKFHSGVTAEMIKRVIYSPEIRLSWDKSVKSYKIIDGGDKYNYVMQTIMFSPVFFISEREVVDKRAEFTYNGISYDISTSIDENYLPIEKNVVRCKNFINSFVIVSDDTHFYFLSFNQVDPKMNLPGSFLNMILPFKIAAFYKTLVEEVNKLAIVELQI